MTELKLSGLIENCRNLTFTCTNAVASMKERMQ